MKSQRITCSGVDFRQGFVEVCSGIHEHHINLETWNIDPETNISGSTLDALPEESIIANTEIELSLSQAKALVIALEAAIHAVESGEAG